MSWRRVFQRRRFLIEDFQYRLLFINFAYFVFTVIAVAAALFVPLINQLQTGQLTFTEQGDVAGLFLFLHARFWPAVIGVFLLLALHSVLTSHRIAGPIYRFRTIYKAVSEGDLLTRARLRRYDYLKGEAESLNAMIESLRMKIREIDAHQRNVRVGMDELRIALNGRMLGDEIVRGLNGLDAEIEELRSSISEFQLEAGKKAPRGFSLIELMIVLMTIGTLSMIAIPEYFETLDRARVAKAIGDIAAIGRECQLFAINNDRYPNNLAEINRGAYPDPYGAAYEYYNIANSTKKGKGGMRMDKFLVPLNSDFDLYSRGKDGLTQAPLTAAQSLDDIVRANDGGFIGLGADY